MILNFITKNLIAGFLANIITGLLEWLGNFVNGIFDVIAEANMDLPFIVNVKDFTIQFALSLVVVLGIWKYFTIYVLETEGDPDADGIDILVRCSQAIAIICCNNWIFNSFMSFSQKFSSDILAQIERNEGGYSGFAEAINNAMGVLVSGFTSTGAIWILFLAVLVGGIVTFLVIAGIRGAELSLMNIMCPLFACFLVNSSHEQWDNFFVKYVTTFMYYSVQLFSYNMFMLCCTDMLTVVDGLTGMPIVAIQTIGWAVLMIRGPKWMENFIYSSGIGNAARGGSQSVMHGAMMLRR
ncbi:MAG: hypothetical protein LIP16_20590 [Clostridium sp.]|nr:hypothetical protein [Clostridium sp.]